MGTADPDWKESTAPPPPALRTEQLVPLELPPPSTLRWGVDPASIQIDTDDVVRYVVVARSDTGAVNAFYEGIRCTAWQVKQYARSGGDKWVAAQDADWKPLDSSRARIHSLVIARSGACIGGGTRTPEQVARNLRAQLR
ncbi:CNP1-like family protein [Ramlibacter humi]|uniref:CNP1-like uncharacterized domain-containing protein n=1 Tax=Ramlibacter humi TaxID=2530451 RepID=A0A4Z0BZP2_9BURK|nr:CNP1-like family protein [Ramlibacter humi]TFZ04004.1 hypothetical protein EZ216_10235 [Ramlibacter humi]